MTDRYEALVSRFGITVSLYRDDEWVKDVLNFPIPGDGKPFAILKLYNVLWARHWIPEEWYVNSDGKGIELTAYVRYRGLIPDDYK